jgi:CDP-diacylglycerol pyrophosphatase
MRRVILCASLWLVGTLVPAHAADPDALWKIVNDRCVPDQQAHGTPAPCEIVAIDQGYAVLKDIRGATQFLLIPTECIGGMESPAILAPETPNYFRMAWAERGRVAARAGHTLADDALSLAINSQFGRTQNQLHIHIDCLRADVRSALLEHAASVGTNWSVFPVPLAGRSYRAIHLAQLNDNPFQVLAHALAKPAAEFAKHTLVLTAAKDGFVLLDGQADLVTANPGSGEELQDHSCALAHNPS